MQYLLRLFLATLFIAFVCAFQRPIRHGNFPCRPAATNLFVNNLRTKSDNNDVTLDILNDRLRNSPGYVSSLPINTTEQSRIELAKFVVAAAVLLLTLNVKMKNVFSQLQLDKLSPATGRMRDGSVVRGPVLLENGIEYTDYVIADSSTPQKGDEVVVLAKLFYNGLQINKGLPNEVIPFICVQGDSTNTNTNSQSSSSHKFLRTSFSPIFADVPWEGLTSALIGLNYGVRRKAILPGRLSHPCMFVYLDLFIYTQPKSSYYLSLTHIPMLWLSCLPLSGPLTANLAFGSKGFAPYIPPGAAVMYEITVSPMNEEQQKGQDTRSSFGGSNRIDGGDDVAMVNDQRIVDTTIVA